MSRTLWKMSYEQCDGDWFEIFCTFIGQTFCWHKWKWYQNFHGMLYSIFMCHKCGKYEQRSGIVV